MSTPHTLICSAVSSELDHIKANVSSDFLCEPVGIGLVESGIRAMAILREFPSIQRVIFVGTCGAYKNSKLRVLDLCQAHEHALVGAASVLGTSYFPEPMRSSFKVEEALNTSLPRVRAATVLEITRNTELAEKIAAQSYAEIEHMEIYAVAYAAQLQKIPCSGFFAIANTVGDSSHEEWLENRFKAEKLIQNYVLSQINM